jgi:hypothetical protein
MNKKAKKNLKKVNKKAMKKIKGGADKSPTFKPAPAFKDKVQE